MRPLTSDSKLFLFSGKKKTSCLLVWEERMADKTKGGGWGGDSGCSLMCVHKARDVCVCMTVPACLCVHIQR